MFYTKKWGMVSSKAELYMLNRAEHRFEEKQEMTTKYETQKGRLSISKNKG